MILTHCACEYNFYIIIYFCTCSYCCVIYYELMRFCCRPWRFFQRQEVSLSCFSCSDLCLLHWCYLSEVFKRVSKLIIFKKYYCLKLIPEAAIKKEPHFACQYITITKVVFLHCFPLNIKADFASECIEQIQSPAPGTFWSSEEFLSFLFSQSDWKVTLYHISFYQIYLWPGGFIKCISSRKFWQWFTWETFTCGEEAAWFCSPSTVFAACHAYFKSILEWQV